MNLINNGSFESGNAEPWLNIRWEPLSFEVVSHNNKNWLLTHGMGDPLDGTFRQLIPQSPELWGVHWRLTFTAKAIPTGGAACGGEKSDADASRLRARIMYYFLLLPQFSNFPQKGGSADVSVVEKTFTQRIVITNFRPTDHGDLVMINWAGSGYDKADILVTDVTLVKVDPEIDPVEPAEQVTTVDLTAFGLPKIEVSAMKEVT